MVLIVLEVIVAAVVEIGEALVPMLPNQHDIFRVFVEAVNAPVSVILPKPIGMFTVCNVEPLPRLPVIAILFELL